MRWRAKELDGLIELPETTRAAIERGIAGEIDGSSCALPTPRGLSQTAEARQGGNKRQRRPRFNANPRAVFLVAVGRLLPQAYSSSSRAVGWGNTSFPRWPCVSVVQVQDC